jgi:hypothetical protein
MISRPKMAFGGLMQTAILMVALLVVTGCTSTNLKSNTTALGPSISDIEKDQIYRNLALFIDSCTHHGSCNAVPNHFILGGGQAQVSNQIQTPNVTANLTGVVFKNLAFQDQYQWTQSWSITPVTDFSDLERLRDLYHFAIALSDGSDSSIDAYPYASFADDYIRTQVKSVDSTNTLPSKVMLLPAPASATLSYELPLPLPPDLPGDAIQPDPRNPKWIGATSPDRWPHRLPNAKWVYWDVSEPPEGTKSVGTFGKHALYVKEDQLQYFMIWILGASPNAAAAAKGGGAKPSSGLINPISP